MSIVALERVMLIGRRADAPALLAELQTLGLMHLDVLGNGAAGDIDARIRHAFRWLSRTRLQRHRQRAAEGFDAGALVARIEAIRRELKALEDERLALTRRIEDVRPWGNFAFADIAGHPELRFWFYEVHAGGLTAFEQSPLVWAEVARDAHRHFVVVIAAEEPADLRARRTHVGGRSLEHLEARLNAVEVAIDDLQAERAGLTRWLGHFEQAIDRLVDRSLHAQALAGMAREGPLVMAEGWAAGSDVERLARFAASEGAVLAARTPQPGEQPPTLLSNPPLARAGEALTGFFTTPDYRSWDPAGMVLASFVLFFAIIVGDAAYGAVLALLLAFAWRALGRTPGGRQLRLTGALLAAATVLWGMLVGTYAGRGPPLAVLEHMHLIPAADNRLMLALAIGIGLVHLVTANAIAARRLWPARAAWARIGWIGMFAAAPLWAAGLGTLAIPLAIAALALIAGFSGTADGALARVGGGAMALTRLVGALGDTLSYLRLFALAIAGTSLAAAFNDLAGQAWQVPGVGVLLGLLILAFGHSLNLVLGVASGVVHGLRLNYIEFFGWGLWGEGRPFRAFARREHGAQA